MHQLRPYQREAIDSLYAYWQRNPTGSPLVVLPTGAGKSLVIAKGIEEFLAIEPATRIVNVTHVKELIEQNFKEFIGVSPWAPAGIFSASLGRREAHAQIMFAGIQTVYGKAKVIGHVDVLKIDEAHLVPTEATAMYGQFIAGLRAINPNLIVVGYTATPYRLDSGSLVEGDDRLFDEITYEVSIRDLIEWGYLAPLISKATSTVLNVKGVARSGGDFTGAALQRAVDKHPITAAAVDEIVAYGTDAAAARKAWLVFCSGVEHAHHVADEIRSRGIAAEAVDGGMARSARDRVIADFRAGKLRALTNANCLTTGFNVPHVDLLAMLRPTLSTSLYCLDTETEILTSHGWKGVGQVNVGDVALAMDLKDGAGIWSRVTGAVRRRMTSEERWVSYDAPRANFRVTDQHRMIFAKKTREGHSGWIVDTAAAMARAREGVRMPTAVSVPQPGVPLTDDELYLIGIIMTDGSISSHQVTIYQSERHPEILEKIEGALFRCGIAYAKARIAAATDFQERYPRWRYSISAGDPKCGRSGKGIRYLYPFVNKDLSPALMCLSRSQFFSLLKGLWDGDGYKIAKLPSCDWTPRSWKLCSARKVMVERFQALAAMHGCTAHLRWESGGRTSPIAVITISDQDWRSVGGSGDNRRPKIVVSAATDEDVWCVETEAGTIVTRRRGKVTVMGNCQMVGRAARCVGPDIAASIAAGKRDGLILDFAGNVRRHGPVDAVRVRKPGDGNGEAPVKECPSCHSIILAAARECPDCGHLFERDVDKKLAASAAAAPILSKAGPVFVKVRERTFYRHDKPGAPPSVRVQYKCGPAVHKEWICPEHQGARGRFEKFWRAHGGAEPFPATVDEALDRVPELREVEEIRIRPSGAYWEVCGHKIAAPALPWREAAA